MDACPGGRDGAVEQQDRLAVAGGDPADQRLAAVVGEQADIGRLAAAARVEGAAVQHHAVGMGIDDPGVELGQIGILVVEGLGHGDSS